MLQHRALYEKYDASSRYEVPPLDTFTCSTEMPLKIRQLRAHIDATLGTLDNCQTRQG